MRADLTRRGLLGTAAAAALPSLLKAQPAEGEMVVTLLGVGSPALNPDRFGPSSLVQCAGLNLLIDAGRGCTIRLNQIGVPLGRVDGVFLTHFHSDHVNGLPDLWMTGYIPTSYANRTSPLKLYGPRGTARIARGMREAFAADMAIRRADEKIPPAAMGIETREFPEEGTVLKIGEVQVRAFRVNHGPLIRPSVGYRIDAQGRSVLFSGDTKMEPNIVRHGQDLDLMVHEVCAAPPELLADPSAKAVIDHHTSPREAGEVFARTRPKMAAYAHIVQLVRGSSRVVGLDEIEAETRQTYDGPLTVGADLTRFVLGPSGVTVRRWRPGSGYA